ncbi:MAG: ABC transporter permease [Kiritimatiellae bacterium]|nr:ABC transporter permease [Kiritimatiellia bacterium]MBR4476348.1 ABC transporter permease [Kiritimatiellia bacterium]
MLKYALRRIAEVIPTTVGILLLTFLLFNVVGGSPAEVILGKNATAESIAAFNRKWGYDKPLIWSTDSQFVNFVGALVKGDLGYSIEMDEPVKDVLLRGVGPSLSLTVPILIGGTIVALMLAMLAAAFRGGFPDKAVLVGSTVLMSVNYVVWVLLGQFLLSFKAGIFPVWGYGGAFYLVLPVLIGVVSSLGTDVRFFRTAILDESYKPYVLTARSKGLSRAAVMLRHILPNALIPIVTYVSLSIPWLFTGSLLLESFFGIPGLGSVSINAIHSADMAVVRALVVLGALLYQFVNLATDLLYAALDPRVRFA